MLHTGYLYKMGNGPINYDWNKRFLVLDQENKKLSYFLSESDKKARNHIDLEKSSVSQLMPIKGRKYSFCIKEGPKGNREVNLSAENEKEAQTWINLINLCTPDDDLPIWETNKIDASRNTNVQISKTDKAESDPKYSNNTDLFTKLKNKLVAKTRATRKSRKTVHVKQNKKLPRMTNVEKEVRLEKGSVAEFGEITNNFRVQLAVIEKYLMNDDWFKLYKFDKGSRITKHQTEKPFIINKPVKKFYIAAIVIYLLDWLIFDFGFGFISLLIILGILSYLKPIVKITKNNTVYRSSKVVDYSSKIIFEYLKSHYRQEVRFCGGRVFKD
jgi:hypothetical protein